MKIVFLGDSLIWGGYGGNFVTHVAEEMPEHTFINAGMAGNTVINLLHRLPDTLAHEPDLIFVMIGGNDAISYLYPDTRPYYRRAQDIETGFVPPDEFERVYRDLLIHIQAHHVRAFVGLEPTEYNPQMVEMMARYNASVREIANSMRIPILDFSAQFTPSHIPERPPISLGLIQQIGQRVATGWSDYEHERQRLGYTYTFDGTHITPNAAKQFAERIMSFLRSQI